MVRSAKADRGSRTAPLPQCSQEEVYRRTTEDLIPGVLEGINTTVFAYGATGAGKTHTIIGSEEQPGIIQLSLTDLFRLLELKKVHAKRPSHPRGAQSMAPLTPAVAGQAEDSVGTWRVVVSYLEVYNEQVYDLLCCQEEQRALKPCEVGSSGEVAVSGLTEREVTDAEAVLTMVREGNGRRRMESTAANKVSSRSHAVLQVAVVHEEPEVDKGPKTRKRTRRHSVLRLGQKRAVKRTTGPRDRAPCRQSRCHPGSLAVPHCPHPAPRRAAKLSLIDLAGSERASATKNRGARLHEGANINKVRARDTCCASRVAGACSRPFTPPPSACSRLSVAAGAGQLHQCAGAHWKAQAGQVQGQQAHPPPEVVSGGHLPRGDDCGRKPVLPLLRGVTQHAQVRVQGQKHQGQAGGERGGARSVCATARLAVSGGVQHCSQGGGEGRAGRAPRGR